MEIIKTIMPEEFNTTCNKCLSELRYIEKDMYFKSDSDYAPFIGHYFINCPVCKNKIKLTNRILV